MGVAPPFIYDKPSSYAFASPASRPFNPKAVTQASWTPPPQRAKREGPLLDFNQHPDSYLIVPYGNLNVEPMNPRTKVRVKRTRKLQLALRILSLIGALGLLFCIIAINKTSNAVGWIIRVGPAVAICHAIYAIHHLARDAAGRSAASTASYMLFAGMLDTGLVPFFVFSAVMAYQDWSANAYGWSTLFGDTELSYKVIYAFFLLCLIEAGFFFVSICLDIYLAIVFRKIAKMPPDMNPLEDNLTARPAGKRHKRNKSEMNFEKHLSGSTLVTQRLSTIKDIDAGSMKRVPFHHTRTDSADRITLYGNEAAFNSRASLRKELIEVQSDPYRSSIGSRHDTLVPSRPGSAMTPAANTRAPGAGLVHKPVRSSGLAQQGVDQTQDSWLSYNDRNGQPTYLSNAASQQLNEEVRPLTPVSMISDREYSPERSQHERQNWYTGSARNSRVQSEDHDVLAHVANYGSLSPPPQTGLNQTKKRSRDPLGMNPPTPIRTTFSDENNDAWTQQSETASYYSTPQRQALQDTHANASTGRPSMGSRPSSFVGSGGKSRYYGNLRSSIGGSPTRSPRRDYPQNEDEGNYYRTSTMQSEDSGNFQVYDSEDDDDDIEHVEHSTRPDSHSPNNAEYHYKTGDARQYNAPNRKPITISNSAQNTDEDEWNGTRKVSNSTGYDLKGGYAGLGAEFGAGMARRREVSGKVAEEGRGNGFGGIGQGEYDNGAVLTGQAVRGGAAGWARFKGL